MFINMTYFQIDPGKLHEFTVALYGPQTAAVYNKFRTMRSGYLLQSTAHPEKVISVTLMDSTAEVAGGSRSSEYAAVLQAIKGFLAGTPSREIFEVISEYKP